VILKELVYNIMDICGSAPHSLLATGRVDAAHPDLATDPLGILRPPSKLCHSLPLVCILPSEALPL
jgi:CCR4-NOT transcription complex subunit 6